MRTRVNVQFYPSPCGLLILASVDDALCLCNWAEYPCAQRNINRLRRLIHAEIVEETSAVIERTKEELDDYFAGKRRAFDVSLCLVGTDFQKDVWRALLEIPYGQTRSYKEIAQQMEHAKGVRAVAQAIGANGLSILVPCHRVVGSDHRLTGFAGGLENKAMLLKLEGEQSDPEYNIPLF